MSAESDEGACSSSSERPRRDDRPTLGLNAGGHRLRPRRDARGGLSNVATVIGELLIEGQLDAAALVSVSGHYPVAVAQRVGYLIDAMALEVNSAIDTTALRDSLVGIRYRELSPGAGGGRRDERWHIVVSTRTEHDL